MMPSSMLDLVLIILCTLVLFVKVGGGGRGAAGEAANAIVPAPKAQNAKAEAALAEKIVVSLTERSGEKVAVVTYPDGRVEWVALDALEAWFSGLAGSQVVFRVANPEVAEATGAIRSAGCDCLVTFD